MNTFVIIIGTICALVALLMLIIALYLLLYKPKTEAERIAFKEDLEKSRRVSPERQAWLHSKENPANKVFPYNLL